MTIEELNDPSKLFQGTNIDLYRARKYGFCNNAKELHILLSDLAESIAECDDPEKRQDLLKLFRLNLPEPELLDIGLA